MKKLTIIGRKEEQLVLKQAIEANSAQFVALYGCRRVGKTYLVKRYFDDKFDFYMSGVYKLPMGEQLSIFAEQMKLYFKKDLQKPKTWFEAFNMLRDELAKLRKRTWWCSLMNCLGWILLGRISYEPWRRFGICGELINQN